MNAEQWIQKLPLLDRPARVAIAVVAILWASWWLADTFWLIKAGPSMPTYDDNLPRIGAVQSGPQSTATLADMQAWELFGPVGEVAQPAVQDAPDTRLRLELLGLFQNPEAPLSGAIIAEQGREGELFRVGDRVPGNATLDEILPDRVILLRAGQREALRLKEPEGGSAPIQAAPVAQASTPRRRVAGGRPQSAPQQEFDPLAEVGGSNADLVGQRNMIIQQMGLSAASGGGYQIGAGSPREVLQQIGLRPGDVLLSVNGHVLGAEGTDLAALDEFRNTGAASIVVQRGAQRFTVNYPP